MHNVKILNIHCLLCGHKLLLIGRNIHCTTCYRENHNRQQIKLNFLREKYMKGEL